MYPKKDLVAIASARDLKSRSAISVKLPTARRFATFAGVKNVRTTRPIYGLFANLLKAAFPNLPNVFPKPKVNNPVAPPIAVSCQLVTIHTFAR